MSDPRQAPQGAPPQGAAPQGGGSAMEQARSPFNPTDMAYAKSRGEVRPDMTIGQFMESQFGVKWDDPLQIAAQKMGKKVETASPVGKMKAMARGGQTPPPADGAQQPMRKPQGGLDALMGQ